MFWNLRFPLLSPDDVGNVSGGDAGASEFQQDMAELESGGDGDEMPDVSDEGDGEGDDEATEEGEGDKHRRLRGKEEEDEEEEDERKSKGSEDEDEGDRETEDEEEDSEEEKPARIEGRPTIQQVKKLYPDLFKRIPYFREIYFTDEKFKAHIADPDQAADFVEKASNFDRLEGSLMRGDPETLLFELKEGNSDAFGKVAKNFLPTLRKLDANLYTELTIPIIEELLYHAAEYGKSRGEAGKNFLRSAEWMADFVFQNGGEIPDIKNRSGEKHPAEIELEKEREKAITKARDAAVVDVNSRIDQSLSTMVREGLGDGLNNFAKNAVIDRTLNEFITSLRGDRAFQMKLATLWKSARAAEFSEASKAQIANAYVQRGKQLLRGIRSKYIAEAQGGKRKVARRENTEEEESKEKKEKGQDREEKPRKRNFDSGGSSNRTGTRRAAVLDSRKIDYARTSDEDILSDDPGRIKLKGQR